MNLNREVLTVFLRVKIKRIIYGLQKTTLGLEGLESKLANTLNKIKLEDRCPV